MDGEIGEMVAGDMMEVVVWMLTIDTMDGGRRYDGDNDECDVEIRWGVKDCVRVCQCQCYQRYNGE